MFYNDYQQLQILNEALKIKENNKLQHVESNNCMEVFQLDPNLLHSIIRDNNISQDTVKELNQWIHNLDPSFGLMKSILVQYFQIDQWVNLSKVGSKIEFVVVNLQEKKCAKSFIRALLAVLKANNDKIKPCLKVQNIASQWNAINPQILEYFFEAFDIKVDTVDNKENNKVFKIPLQEYEARIRGLIEKKDYDGAITLIKLIKYPEEYVKLLLSKMANNKDASKAAGIIKTHKIDQKIVPQVGQRLNKNMVRYFHKSHGWEGAEEIFQDNPQALATLVEDLIYKNSIKQAISIWWRHPQLMKHITKKDTLDVLQKEQNKNKEQMNAQIVENPLFKDNFGPSKLQYFLTLKQLGINRQDVVWLEQEPEVINEFIKQLGKADILAIDTQSVVGKTKLERNKNQPASIVQFAFRNRIYILDGLRCKSKKLQQGLLDYINSGRPIIGHAISNDLDAMLLSIGISEEEVGLIKFNNIIDTNTLFKAIYPKQKYSNLAYICKTVLKKEICKQQTLSNWSRRPLRQNQIHYAAMDAFCLIKIYDALKEQVGQNMLNYFLNRQFD